MDTSGPLPGKEEILEKLRHFCGWGERSPRALNEKMRRLGVVETEADWHRERLKEEGFFDPARFEAAYRRGKSRLKGWGPAKIRAGLQREMLGESHQEPEAWPEEDRREALLKLEKELLRRLAAPNPKPDLRNKLLRFCLSRGFALEESRNLIARLTEKNGS